MREITVLIVEDEPIIAEDLRLQLSDLGYRVIGPASRIEQAKHLLNRESADIAIVDVMLDAGDDGVELGQWISQNLRIPFIFLTALKDRDSVERAKNAHPAGYLVKPFQIESVQSTLEIALHQSRRILERDPDTGKEYYFVRSGDRWVKLKISDILYAEAEDNYTRIVTDREDYLLSVTLKAVEEKIKHPHMVRVHRSYLVNLEKADGMQDQHLLIGKRVIPIGKSYREDLMKKISMF